MTVDRVFLVGLSGSGKTTVGRKLARRLDWEFVDTDEEIEARAGRSVASIFADDGEDAFRDLEANVLRDVAARAGTVIATGGGAPLRGSNREVLAGGLVIWLDITPRGAERRLAAAGGADTRPLLSGGAGPKLEALFERRRHLYERSDHSFAVDYYNADRVSEMAAETVRKAIAAGWIPSPGRFDEAERARRRAARVAATVRTDSASYPVVVDSGVLDTVGAICRERGLAGRAFVLTDSNVERLFAGTVLGGLEAAGFEAKSYAIPPGEPSKTMVTLAAV
ncbi:MAG: shikimate kinase, partial [Dehalococcoidia bacterium]